MHSNLGPHNQQEALGNFSRLIPGIHQRTQILTNWKMLGIEKLLLLQPKKTFHKYLRAPVIPWVQSPEVAQDCLLG